MSRYARTIARVLLDKVLSRNILRDKPRCERSEQQLDISLLLCIEHPCGKARRNSKFSFNDSLPYPECQLLQFITGEFNFIVENVIVRADVRSQSTGMGIQIEIELTRMNNGGVDHRAGRHVADALTIGSKETRVMRLLNDHEGYLW